MTVARPITDAGQAARTDSVKIAFVQGEVATAVPAGRRFALARATARGTAHHRGLVADDLFDFEQSAATAMEATAHRTTRHIVLPMTFPAAGQASVDGVQE
jgi:hypothetical protein